ncbi:FAD-binding domain [Henriciella aquimarina]|uniref:FAD-binding domain n=1 Tax=Henriciella aquimarina TaxID=545261 RepID=UPI0009FF2B72|nr:FAD-binding domain [Henriciella aquimarina]
MHIAISGAGVAGPTLAWWLDRAGHDVTLIEQAPDFRTGGYIIDFWGVGYEVARRMGLEPAILEAGYTVDRVRFVDKQGKPSASLPVSVFAKQLDGHFTSLPRGNLAALIYKSVEDRIRTRFGDSLASVEQDEAKVFCTLTSGRTLEADMLIGADGLHSKTRELVFGPEKQFERDLGFRVAAFKVKGYRPREEGVYVSHNEPGISMSRFSMANDETLFMLVYRAGYAFGARPENEAEVRDTLRGGFRQAGWEARAIMEAMDDADEIYFDVVSQIEMPSWSKGRVGLIGDAAACVSLLAGEGTGLAMTEAYVLAGELQRAGNDVPAALTAYEHRLKPFLKSKQKAARSTASSFAPKTAFGVWFRNLVVNLMGLPFVADWALGGAVKDNFELPEYEAPK